jgi:inosine-uridine nucleoside N-ribohydrolase
MAEQIDVPGNAYLDNAEFNWWFDPEATKLCCAPLSRIS